MVDGNVAGCVIRLNLKHFQKPLFLIGQIGIPPSGLFYKKKRFLR